MFLILLFLNITYAEEITCSYGEVNTCPNDKICVHFENNIDSCINKYTGPLKVIAYPYSENTPSICDQGPMSPSSNSHTWTNTAFAIDLIAKEQTSARLVAGANGRVIAFNDCTTKNDQCGNGFGNQVKILTEDNFIIFYAHLDEVKVKTGQYIQKGDIIGSEGMTGWTGANNKHLHLSVHYDWKTSGEQYWKNVGYLPFSVPFSIEACHETISVQNLQCKRTSDTVKLLCPRLER